MPHLQADPDVFYSKASDLALLSLLGHLLKGSPRRSASQSSDSCRKIQHYGQKKDETGTIAEPDEAKCLYRIEDTLVAVKEECAEAEKVLKIFSS
jgi:osomolarity two-component system phosphorelay intermediate protein YPD1